MPNYLIVNLDTREPLASYSHGIDLFAEMVRAANHFRRLSGQRIAVMGQPFCVESQKFTSELYVAEPD